MYAWGWMWSQKEILPTALEGFFDPFGLSITPYHIKLRLHHACTIAKQRSFLNLYQVRKGPEERSASVIRALRRGVQC